MDLTNIAKQPLKPYAVPTTAEVKAVSETLANLRKDKATVTKGVADVKRTLKAARQQLNQIKQSLVSGNAQVGMARETVKELFTMQFGNSDGDAIAQAELAIDRDLADFLEEIGSAIDDAQEMGNNDY